MIAPYKAQRGIVANRFYTLWMAKPTEGALGLCGQPRGQARPCPYGERRYQYPTKISLTVGAAERNAASVELYTWSAGIA